MTNKFSKIEEQVTPPEMILVQFLGKAMKAGIGICIYLPQDPTAPNNRYGRFLVSNIGGVMSMLAVDTQIPIGKVLAVGIKKDNKVVYMDSTEWVPSPPAELRADLPIDDINIPIDASTSLRLLKRAVSCWLKPGIVATLCKPRAVDDPTHGPDVFIIKKDGESVTILDSSQEAIKTHDQLH